MSPFILVVEKIVAYKRCLPKRLSVLQHDHEHTPNIHECNRARAKTSTPPGNDRQAVPTSLKWDFPTLYGKLFSGGNSHLQMPYLGQNRTRSKKIRQIDALFLAKPNISHQFQHGTTCTPPTVAVPNYSSRRCAPILGFSGRNGL